MRFYFGFSKKIPIKWILIAIGGLLAFFGITSQAHALELSNYNHENIVYFKNNSQTATFRSQSNTNGLDFNGNLNFDNYFNNSLSNRYAFFYVSSFYYNGVYNNNYYYSINNYLSNYRVRLVTNGIWISCINQDNVIICPLSSDSNVEYRGLNFSGSIYNPVAFNGQNIYFSVELAAYTDIYSTTNNQAIIDNNNQNTQAIINGQNNINSSINNSTIDSSTSNGGGYFENFTINDNVGLSSIIVAPIQFLRDLLTSGASCNPISFSLNMQDDNILVSNNGLSLPCGDVLWNRVPQAIELVWITLIWGLVGYRLLIDVVRFSNDMLNPMSTKEYVLDF